MSEAEGTKAEEPRKYANGFNRLFRTKKQIANARRENKSREREQKKKMKSEEAIKGEEELRGLGSSLQAVGGDSAVNTGWQGYGAFRKTRKKDLFWIMLDLHTGDYVYSSGAVITTKSSNKWSVTWPSFRRCLKESSKISAQINPMLIVLPSNKIRRDASVIGSLGDWTWQVQPLVKLHSSCVSGGFADFQTRIEGAKLVDLSLEVLEPPLTTSLTGKLRETLKETQCGCRSGLPTLKVWRDVKWSQKQQAMFTARGGEK
ncbi:hypothetical protein Hamer_G005537, partial [Homarus americanus]